MFFKYRYNLFTMNTYKRSFSQQKGSKKKNLPNNSNYFRKKYARDFGKNIFDEILMVKNSLEKNQFIRVNISKISTEKIEEFMQKEGIKYEKTFFPNFFKITRSPYSLASSPEHLMGWFYLQDLASGVPINCINWQSFQDTDDSNGQRFQNKEQELRVLDLCASPGSKTTQICDTLDSLNINYKLYAIEPQQKRLSRLINNIQKMNLKNVEVFQGFGESISTRDLGLPRGDEGNFDVILVDAPCSGNIIGDRNWLQKRNEKGIYENSTLQKKILSNAKSMLKEDGILIYSTCSLEIEENEENIHYAIKELGMKTIDPSLTCNFNTAPITKGKGGNFDKEVSKCIRFMPHISKTEGFFVGVLKK